MASDDAVATTIRRACGEDAPRLARLRYDFRIEIAQPSEPEAAFLSRCTRWMTERLAGESSWLCWVAQSGEDLIGQVWLQRIEKIPNPVDEAEHHGYISSLYVTPERRGQGVGGALLGAAIHEAANLGVHALLLWPTERSRSLYAQHGFATRDDVMELILTS